MKFDNININETLNKIYNSLTSYCPNPLKIEESITILREFKELVKDCDYKIPNWQRLDFIGENCADECMLSAYTLKQNFNIDSIFVPFHTADQAVERTEEDKEALINNLNSLNTCDIQNPCTICTLLVKNTLFSELGADLTPLYEAVEANINNNWKAWAQDYFNKQITIIKPEVHKTQQSKVSIVNSLKSSNYEPKMNSRVKSAGGSIHERSWYYFP